MHSDTTEVKPSGTSTRAHARVPVKLHVTLQAGAPRLFDEARDLCEGGLGVLTTSPLPVGTPVVVRMPLAPHGEDVAEQGVIAWVRDGAMGVRFETLGVRTSDAIDALRRALRRN